MNWNIVVFIVAIALIVYLYARPVRNIVNNAIDDNDVEIETIRTIDPDGHQAVVIADTGMPVLTIPEGYTPDDLKSRIFGRSGVGDQQRENLITRIRQQLVGGFRLFN